MGYLDDVEPSVKVLLKSRGLFLRERADDSPPDVIILVCWDDGYDGGLPVGTVKLESYRRTFIAHARTDFTITAAPEVARDLPDVNEAIRQVLLHLTPRYLAPRDS
ncbi:hypothetical protein [Saccharothrix luteola]|uniref:hypothetical protein n=1 Tax=Saccharothrix luteola TaxID=2893018 RepID=UPI001E3537A8|nr:hypothetical protein [Saccharothrix luteola]MCC8248257.1 hypothetical protein [Saccharothrix luteola]